ncbi:MAG: LytTR family transcriptional regulator [Cellvibrionaceae bacterium]|nr:LytTR family transcriptional regulator [Cellvibrionaceae bacterium]
MINGTVLGVAPIKTSLLVMGGVMSVFCTFVEPEVSAGLSLLPRFAFWVSHVGVGLLGILLASLILSRCWPHRQLSLFVTIGLTGMLGTLLATPGLLLVEEFFPKEIDQEWLDIFGQRGWWQALLAEYLQVLPKLLPIWYLVNLPLLFNKPVLHPLPQHTEPDAPPPDEQAQREEELRQRRERLYEKLPEVIGRDIVAISSDLHYLNVHTVLGKFLVLGSLKHYAEAFGEEGVLVHRSNWVAKRHVVKVRTSGDEAYCLMSNGLKVPVSRSRRKQVKALFGDAVRAPQERRLTLVK